MSERGQSETIGFILIFSLIIISTGIIFVQGTTGLEQARNDEQTQNAVRAFNILSANVEDISRDAAPSRETEIQLGGGRLSVEEPMWFNVSITDQNGVTETYPSYMYAITYESEGAGTVVYSNSAVFRQYETAGTTESVLVSKPQFKIRGSSILISQYRVRPEGGKTKSVSGSGTALIRTEGADSQVVLQQNPSEVTVEIGPTPRRDTWIAHFEESGFSCTTPEPGVAECSKTSVDRVYIQQFYIVSDLK